MSKQFSRRVFEDALVAMRDPSHPCHHLIEWQREKGFFPFHLPEPFSGRRATLGIAFIGLNPGIAKDEVIPCYRPSIKFDEYDAYYRRRFESRDTAGKLIVHKTGGITKKPRLWNNIELFGRRFLGEICDHDFRLGEHAVLLEVVRFKTAKGWLGRTARQRKQVLNHQLRFTQQILEKSGFHILVPMGNQALRQLAVAIEFRQPPPPSAVEAMGRCYQGRTSSGRVVSVCPIKHMSYPPPHRDQKAVADAIIRAARGSVA